MCGNLTKMLTATFARNMFVARKVLFCPCPAFKFRTSSLTSGSLQNFSTSLAWPPSKEANSGLLKRSSPERTQLLLYPFLMKNQHFHSSAMRMKKRPKPEPPPRELDLLRFDMKELSKSPKPALYLGFAGLLPFVCPPLLMAVTESCFQEMAYAQVAYGATIISFLGGARWGFALPETSPAKPDWINLTNSVIPPLVAWTAMVLSDITSAAIMVIMGLGISLHYDLSLLPTYPSWFKALRAVLTIVAFFSLVGTLIVNGMYPECKFFSD